MTHSPSQNGQSVYGLSVRLKKAGERLFQPVDFDLPPDLLEIRVAGNEFGVSDFGMSHAYLSSWNERK
jgi:hypothetical protein